MRVEIQLKFPQRLSYMYDEFFSVHMRLGLLIIYTN